MVPRQFGPRGGGVDYPYQGYREAWAGMRHALVARDEVFILTAPAGAGKTTLLSNFLNDCMSDDIFIATADSADLERGSLFDHMLSLLDLPLLTPDNFAALEQVSERLINYTHALLAIDDAHALTDSAFRDLLKLSYLRRARGPLLQVFLVGEDSFLPRLESSELLHMNLWRTDNHRLAPLSRAETGEFVQAWLRRLDCARRPAFTAEALELVHRWSRGIPGQLVRLCHWLVYHGGAEDRGEFGRDEVRRAIRGQRGLDIVAAHATLAPHSGNAVPSMDACEPGDGGLHVAGATVPDDGETDSQRQDSPGPVQLPTASAVEPSLFGSDLVDPDAGSNPVPSADRERESPAREALTSPRPAPPQKSWDAARLVNASWLTDRLAELRVRRGAIVALVILGLVGAFQLGRQLSGTGPTRTEMGSAPASSVAATPPVPPFYEPASPSVTPAIRVPLRTGSAPAPEAESAPATAPPAPSSPAPLDSRNPSAPDEGAVLRAGTIATLLELGNEALEKDYLRTPREESAWHYYQQVLEIDPGNVAATLGMKLIVARYAELTRRVIERGDLDSARVFINRGLGVAPNDTSLVQLREEVNAARAKQVAAAEQQQQALQGSVEVEEEEVAAEPTNPLQWLQRLLRGGEQREAAPVEEPDPE